AEILGGLDSIGNSTKAITKGMAIATAVIAATSLFGSFEAALENAGYTFLGIRVDQPDVLVGLMLGGCGAFLVSSVRVRAPLATARSPFLGIRVAQPDVLVGLLLGGCVAFLFSSLAIRAVGRAAMQVVVEGRNQFRHHPGIMTYEEKPDYAAVVDICTRT